MAAATSTAIVSDLATTLAITVQQLMTIINNVYPNKICTPSDRLSIDEVTALTYAATIDLGA